MKTSRKLDSLNYCHCDSCTVSAINIGTEKCDIFTASTSGGQAEFSFVTSNMFTFSSGIDFNCAVTYGTIVFQYYKDQVAITSQPSIIYEISPQTYTVRQPQIPQSDHFGEYRIEMKITLPHGQTATGVQWLYVSDNPSASCSRSPPSAILQSYNLPELVNPVPYFSPSLQEMQTYTNVGMFTLVLPNAVCNTKQSVTVSVIQQPVFVTIISTTTPYSLKINPSQGTIGTHEVQFQLSTGDNTATESLKIIVKAPFFTSALQSQIISVGTTTNYQWPQISQPSDGVLISVDPNHPWLDITYDYLRMTPTATESGLSFTITVTLSNSVGIDKTQTDYEMEITVNSFAPVFTSNPVSQTIVGGGSTSYQWPSISYGGDINSVSLLLSSQPLWCSYSMQYLTMSPGLTDLGTFQFSVTLKDSLNLGKTYSMNIIVVTSLPPYFKTSLVDQTAIQGIALSYALPSAIDPENNLCTVSLVSSPAFVTLSMNDIVINADATASLGSHIVKLSINDGTNQPEFSFNVILVANQIATFASAPLNQQILAGKSLSYTLPATSDPENQPTSISMVTGGPSFVSFISPNVLNINPGLMVPAGIYNVQVKVNDGFSDNLYTIQIAVQAATNNPPYFSTALSTQIVTEGQSINYCLPPIIDPESDTCSIHNIFKPSWCSTSCTFNTNSNCFTISPPIGQIGTITVTFDLKDPTHTVSSSFQIIVQANSPPYFSFVLSSQVLTEGQSKTYTLPTIIDPESDTITISNLSKPSWCSFDPEAKSFQIAPPFGSVNVHIVTFDLSDPTHTVSQIFYIHVQGAPNTAPTFSAALVAQSTPAGIPKTYKLPSQNDAQSNTITIGLQTGGPSFITLVNTDVISISPGLLDVGSFKVTVTLSDGSLQTTYPLDVTVTNTAPTFASNPIDQIVYQGIPVSYTLPTIADGENQPVQISIAPVATWYTASLTTLKMIPTVTEEGSYPVTVKITDTFSSNSYSMKIIVNTNQPPLFATPLVNQVGYEGIPWTYTVPTINDPENQPCTVSLSSGSPAFVSLSGKVISFNPSAGQIGTYIVYLDLSDSFNTIPVPLNLEVKVNTKAVFSSSPVAQLTSTGAHLLYTLPTAQDAEGQTTSITMTSGPSFVTFTAPNILNINPAATDAGAYSVQVDIDDGFSKNPYLIAITVLLNQPPQFLSSLAPSISVYQDDLMIYQLPAVFDPESNQVTITVVPVNKMISSFFTFNSNNQTLILKPTSLCPVGTYTFDIGLYDGITAGNQYQLKVDVLAPVKISQYFTQDMSTVIKTYVNKTLAIDKLAVISPLLLKQSTRDEIIPTYLNFIKNPISKNCQIKNGNLECSPSLAGQYQQVIQLKDQNLILIEQIIFNLEVPSSSSASLNQEVSISNSTNSSKSSNKIISNLSNSTIIESNQSNQYRKKVVTDRKKINLDLVATISDISNTGQVTITFSDDVNVPSSFDDITQDVIQIRIFDRQKNKQGRKLQSENQDLNSINNITWRVISFSSRKLRIQLNFTDPLQISKVQYHQIELKFIQNGYFVDKNSQRAIVSNYVVSKLIPKQLRNDSKLYQNLIIYRSITILRKQCPSIQSICDGNSAVKLFFELIFVSRMHFEIFSLIICLLTRSASLQQLWGMINVLQLILRVPLFNIGFPSNVQVLFGILIDITNFQYFSFEVLENKLFDFTPSDAFSSNFESLDIF